MLIVRLRQQLIRLDYEIIPANSEFEVVESVDIWTIPGEEQPMYTIISGEYKGQTLHRYYCSIIE